MQAAEAAHAQFLHLGATERQSMSPQGRELWNV